MALWTIEGLRAVVTPPAIGGGAGALVPVGVGLLLAVVYGRTRRQVYRPAGHRDGRRPAGAASR